MEVEFKQESVQQFLCVYTNSIHQEETIESVVPDTLPDIGRILSTDCVVYLRSKNMQDGKVAVEGNLQAEILYLAEESTDVLRLEVTKPVTFTWESDLLQEKDTLCVRLHVHSADSRSLNPRKILLRADVQCEISAYRREEWNLPIAAEEENLQILSAESPLLRIAHVSEKAFSVSEEFSVPSNHSGVGEILTARIKSSVDEMKSVGEKVILQGTINLQIMYIPKDDNAPKTENFTTVFSQIMDCAENASGPHSIQLMPTSLRLEPVVGGSGTPVILMELHMLAQLICRDQRTLHYISDAYSLSGCEVLETENITVCTGGETRVLRETVREILEIPESAAAVVDGSVQLGAPMLGERGIRIPLIVNVIYKTENDIVSAVSRRIQADIACDDMKACQLYLRTARCQDCYFSATSGGIETRLPVEIILEQYEEKCLSVVKTVSIDNEAPQQMSPTPSLTLVRCRDTDLWSMAKRYRTTRERIENANKNSVEIGQLLLIPRTR